MLKFTIVIHGGAGTILRSAMTPELEKAYKEGLEQALHAGYTLLEKNGTSLDAVKAAVMSLEDCILFNAGRGSVFAKDGSQEMDASIMEGKTLMAGAVSAVRSIKNPVDLAYVVMTKSQHVMLNGKGAYDFALRHGIKTEPDSYFFSQFRYDQWKELQGTDEAALDHNVPSKEKKFGTVGAVALDKHGNIAAATSTGGMTNKQYGRVGDSPIIGAGTYANNKTCAISCTGHGEPFIRSVTAYDVSCLMEYKGLSLNDAMHLVVHDKLLKIDGEGGMIGVDAKGNAAMVFNSEGMYRGMKCSDGRNEIAVYK
ncbi:MAG TPA: isoaspartyl peptidase/L-asparaginase [Chitinophagaceae bacterium]|nr:isoaspartyl peptidase/L-asparaginase [Chitinophagaceae bacterium]HQX73408.1 isoaspartyl peptidase/L-asparaginase [Chitinophagaceae bacterium]HQZ73239.1 isoaspartyl peptidase/L-asparaginase [Chitinophagaceae bacterium]